MGSLWTYLPDVSLYLGVVVSMLSLSYVLPGKAPGDSNVPSRRISSGTLHPNGSLIHFQAPVGPHQDARGW